MLTSEAVPVTSTLPTFPEPVMVAPVEETVAFVTVPATSTVAPVAVS